MSQDFFESDFETSNASGLQTPDDPSSRELATVPRTIREVSFGKNDIDARLKSSEDVLKQTEAKLKETARSNEDIYSIASSSVSVKKDDMKAAKQEREQKKREEYGSRQRRQSSDNEGMHISKRGGEIIESMVEAPKQLKAPRETKMKKKARSSEDIHSIISQDSLEEKKKEYKSARQEREQKKRDEKASVELKGLNGRQNQQSSDDERIRATKREKEYIESTDSLDKEVKPKSKKTRSRGKSETQWKRNPASFDELDVEVLGYQKISAVSKTEETERSRKVKKHKMKPKSASHSESDGDESEGNMEQQSKQKNMKTHQLNPVSAVPQNATTYAAAQSNNSNSFTGQTAAQIQSFPSNQMNGQYSALPLNFNPSYPNQHQQPYQTTQQYQNASLQNQSQYSQGPVMQNSQTPIIYPYTFRGQDQFGYQPYMPGTIMGQNAWNNQPDIRSNWIPGMSPTGFNFNYYVPETENGASAIMSGASPPHAGSAAPAPVTPAQLPVALPASASVPVMNKEKEEQGKELEQGHSLKRASISIFDRSMSAHINDEDNAPPTHDIAAAVRASTISNKISELLRKSIPSGDPEVETVLEKIAVTAAQETKSETKHDSEVKTDPKTESASVPAQALFVSPPPKAEVMSAIAQHLNAVIPTVQNQEQEFQRIAALYSLGILDDEDHPRLNKITQMTTRLLGRNCCILSLVDTDKVYWKSTSWAASAGAVIQITEEPRYESFCSWVIQEESGRGVTILDAKQDPRCTHMRLKPGLEFYAGVPVIINGKHRIGALSIQGTASAQISVIDMNILHEMASWASGELDTIILQKQLQDREKLLTARDKLSLLCNDGADVEARNLEKGLTLVREALGAQALLLFKLNPDAKGFQSMLQAYSIAPQSQMSASLAVGEDMFRELCSLTLKKDGEGASLLLDNLKTGAVTKDVDHFLSKKINKCLSEIVWGDAGPCAILAGFFEGAYRTLTADDLRFFKDVIPNVSNLLCQIDIKDSFQQAVSGFKSIASAVKKHPVQFGTQQGLAPCVMILEPRISSIKGYPALSLSAKESKASQRILVPAGAKGQALAQALAPNSITPSTAADLKPVELLPIETFEVMHDFSQLIDNLADKYNLKRAKKYGRLAHVGIHTDFLSASSANDTNELKDEMLSIVNGAYELKTRADSILTSEVFYHQTKEYCSFEKSNPLIIQGKGSFSTYRLIGISQNVHHHSEPVPENGLNDKGSMIVSKVPASDASKVDFISPTHEIPVKPQPGKKKANCIIL